MQNWYNIAKAQDGGSAEVAIYDEIGGWGISAKQFLSDLSALKGAKEITLRINSPGGSVTDGTAIYNAIRDLGANVTAKIDGIAASMASVIAMAASKIIMPGNALMMVHNPWTVSYGEADQLRADADLLDKMKSQIVGAYVRKTGKNADEISKLMDATTWMTGDEAKAAGFADEVVDPIQAVAAINLGKLGDVDPRALALLKKGKGDASNTAATADEGAINERIASAVRAAKDTFASEHAAELASRENRIIDLLASNKQLECDVASVTKSRDELTAKVTQAEKDRDAALRQFSEIKVRHEKLLTGGVTFKSEKSFADLVSEHGYEKARKDFPQAYKAFTDSQVNHKSK